MAIINSAGRTNTYLTDPCESKPPFSVALYIGKTLSNVFHLITMIALLVGIICLLIGRGLTYIEHSIFILDTVAFLDSNSFFHFLFIPLICACTVWIIFCRHYFKHPKLIFNWVVCRFRSSLNDCIGVNDAPYLINGIFFTIVNTVQRQYLFYFKLFQTKLTLNMILRSKLWKSVHALITFPMT